MCLTVIKRVKNYRENTSLGGDALAKYVEKYDSAKCGLIDSMGRKQKTIVINESDHKQKISWVNKSFLYPLKEEGEVLSKHPQVKLMMNAQKKPPFPKRLNDQTTNLPISQTTKRPND